MSMRSDIKAKAPIHHIKNIAFTITGAEYDLDAVLTIK